MPRKPDERITQAKELYLKGQKLIEIASQLGEHTDCLCSHRKSAADHVCKGPRG